MADLPFQRRTEKKKSEEVKENMDRSVMEEKSGDEAPIFMPIDD